MESKATESQRAFSKGNLSRPSVFSVLSAVNLAFFVRHERSAEDLIRKSE